MAKWLIRLLIYGAIFALLAAATGHHRFWAVVGIGLGGAVVVSTLPEAFEWAWQRFASRFARPS